mgnify:CR=1 FL=1
MNQKETMIEFCKRAWERYGDIPSGLFGWDANTEYGFVIAYGIPPNCSTVYTHVFTLESNKGVLRLMSILRANRGNLRFDQFGNPLVAYNQIVFIASENSLCWNYIKRQTFVC